MVAPFSLIFSNPQIESLINRPYLLAQNTACGISVEDDFRSSCYSMKLKNEILMLGLLHTARLIDKWRNRRDG